MKLTINLATRRYVNMPLINAAIATALLLLAGLLVLRVRELALNQAELVRVRKLTAAAGKVPGAPTVTEAQLQAVQKRIRFANDLIDKKSMNWLGLLDGLEEVVPAGVALTEIAPGAKEQVVIRGVATDFSAVRALLDNMERSKNFADVYLMSQAEEKVGQTQHGTAFTVNCRMSYR